MAHVFPPRAFKPEEIVDPQWLDKSLQPIAEKIYGRINEHDIRGEFPLSKVFVTNGDRMYDIGAYTNKYLTSDNWAPGFGLSVTGFGANGWFKTATITDYSQAWQVVDTCTMDIEFNDESLWICAMLQYATFRGIGAGIVSPTVPSSDPARVQFALRVDGLIIPETVTGAYIYPDTPKQMIYKGKDVSVINSDFDYRHVRYVQNTEGIGGAAKPVRLTYQAAVVEGAHTVDVVVRRLPQSDGSVDNDSDGSTVCIYNKQLFVMTMNGNGDIGAQTAASTVKPFDEAEVLSKASLFDNRISVIANRMNNLAYFNTERGALRKQHLPSAVKAFDTNAISGSVEFNYVGPPVYDDHGVITGWVPVQDTSGNVLRVDRSGSGWNLSDNPGWLIVMANVQLYACDNSNHTQRQTAMGCFCIRFKTANLGYVNVMGGLTEVFCTNDAFVFSINRPDNNKSFVHDISEDVPLFFAIDTDSLIADLGEAQVEHIEVSCCYWPGSNPGYIGSKFSTRGGTISAWIQER